MLSSLSLRLAPRIHLHRCQPNFRPRLPHDARSGFKTFGSQESTSPDNTKATDMSSHDRFGRPFGSHEQNDDPNAPPTDPNPSYSAAQPHAPRFSAHHDQAAQAYYNQWAHYHQWAQYNQQWAQYYQQMALAGGPQGFFYPNPYGMQHMFAPAQQTYTNVSGAAQYEKSSGYRKQSHRLKCVNTRARSFVPTAYQGQINLTQSVSLAPGGTDQLNNGTPVAETPTDRKLHKDPKIMLPAPQLTLQYMQQAAGQPEVVDPPDLKLVILDLNGTLLHRPNPRKQPKKMIGRPMLPQFLRYLFDNFAVMIWSSAKPENVDALVEHGLEDYKSRLVAIWARNTLGLTPSQYSKNVQCYKDLTRVWASDEIQRNMLGYNAGKRFDQRNTILIDDSALKAAAQPHNLLEIPEFKGVADVGIKQDVLAEVAGYLELLKMQQDVSKFIHKTPFKADATWSFDWQQLVPSDGENPAKDVGATDGTQLMPIVIGN